MQYITNTAPNSQLATASDNMALVRNHNMAKEKMLDFFDMFNHQKEAVLAADSAYQSGMEAYLVDRDALKFEICSDHYANLLNHFTILTNDVQVTMDDYAAAKYQYLTAFPLGHPEGGVPVEDANPALVTGSQALPETLI